MGNKITVWTYSKKGISNQYILDDMIEIFHIDNMPRQTKVSMTFVNLPVSDLKSSIAFYSALGFDFNPQFTDDTIACLIINEISFAMLFTYDRFTSLTKNPIPDTKKFTSVQISLALPSKEDVDALMAKALAASGNEPVSANDFGFMYQRTFADLDGHRWDPFFWDTSKMPVSSQ